jgi:hypothetical protein
MNDREKGLWLLDMLKGKSCTFEMAYIKKPGEDWESLNNPSGVSFGIELPFSTKTWRCISKKCESTEPLNAHEKPESAELENKNHF